MLFDPSFELGLGIEFFRVGPRIDDSARHLFGLISSISSKEASGWALFLRRAINAEFMTMRVSHVEKDDRP